MNKKIESPKGFGEILDHTFRLSKERFSHFIMIMIILIGPIYVLQAMVYYAYGTSFFREVVSGSEQLWYDQLLSRFVENDTVAGSMAAMGWIMLLGFISLFLMPVALAAIMLTVNHIKKNESFTAGSVIQKAFSRFWPLIGSSILFYLILMGVIMVSIIIITIGAIVAGIVHVVAGILVGGILFIGLVLGAGYLLTRLSFYFGSVLFDKESLGFSRSWHLTSKRTWTLLGLYIVFFLIIASISGAVQVTLGLLLGNSVLSMMLVNFVTLFTTVLFSVGYAIMYLDLKIRHDADDLKEMLEEYNAG